MAVFSNRCLICRGLLSVVLTGMLAWPAAADEPSPSAAPVRNEDHQFAKRVRSWKELKQRNIVMQRRDYSCGAAALATVVKYYWGDDTTEDQFLVILDRILTREEAIDRIRNGLAMSDLRRAAVEAGYQAVVGRLNVQGLLDAKVPLIVGISVDEYDHFVVYRGSDIKWVYLADPIRGNIRVLTPVFLKQWQKNAVLAIHKPGHKVKKSSPLSLREEELRLGELNDELIRTQFSPSRQPAHPPELLGP